MKVLVIGGAGYIGSHVVLALLQNQYQVTVFDNLSSGSEMNLFGKASFVKADILDSNALRKTLQEGFDAVIHLAAFKAAGESMLKPEKYSLNNISGTINILNACCEAGIKYIVFSSSAAVYGDPQYLPMDEKHPTIPTNYYGYTKLAIEGFLHWYDKLKGLKFSALRYFNAAGYDQAENICGLEKNPANLLPIIMEVALGWQSALKIFGNDYPTRDGTGVRDYIHVTDLAQAHVLAISRLAQTNESFIVNLGSEKGISVLEIWEAVCRITGQDILKEIADRRPGDPAELYATARTAVKLLGWKPEFSDLDTIVRSTWNVYKQNKK